MDKANMANNKNRRVFFRIYDQVNLFYRKIDRQPAAESDPYPDFDNILHNPVLSPESERLTQEAESLLPPLKKSLPESRFKEHETLNVNISASGMAFICEQELKPGDYLVFEIQLVAAKAAIATYGKIVYCRDNHSDEDQYPYFVGAHFVNMDEADRELLSKHIDKKRRKQRWVNGAILAAVVTALAAPDTVFSVLGVCLHFLFGLLLHGLHLGFEFIESNLDHLVEHLFHTDLHQTQVIVFYILFIFAVYIVYRLCRALPSFYRHSKKSLFAACAHKKSAVLFFWQEQSLIDKVKIAAISIAAITAYAFFGM